jgi:peptidoglycan hydrolase-like protein with peptidoglycan-binding domain
MIKGIADSCLVLISNPLSTNLLSTTRKAQPCTLNSRFWLSLLAITISVVLGKVPALFAYQVSQNSAAMPTQEPAVLNQFGIAAPNQPLLLAQADSYLSLGATGDAVVRLQTRLANLNYYQGAIDGDFGSETEAAVIEFQQSRSLTPDGVVGPRTAAALGISNTATNPPGNSPPRSSSLNTSLRGERYSLLELQRRLQARGFYQGPLDGTAGPQTRAAIAAAQRAYRLSESDIVNGQF